MRTLAIVQPKALKGRIELREGGRDGALAAVLTPAGKRRAVEAGAESWTIEPPPRGRDRDRDRDRSLGKRIVHASGSEVGRWHTVDKKARFAVDGGGDYLWRRLGKARRAEWGFVDDDEQFIVRVHYRAGVLRAHGEAVVEQPDALPPRSALILAVAGIDREIARMNSATADAGMSAFPVSS